MSAKIETEIDKELKILNSEIKNKEMVLDIQKNKTIRELKQIKKEDFFKKKKKPSFFIRLLRIFGYERR